MDQTVPHVIRDKEARKDVKGLLQIMQTEKDINLRSCAAESLGRLGDKRAVDPLIKLLKDQENIMRFTAATSLGQIGDTRAVEPLIKALGDKEKAVCLVAARALGELRDARASFALVKLLNEEQPPMIRAIVANALVQIQEANK